MIKLMIVVVMAFTLCWLPFNVLMVVGDQFPEVYMLPYINFVYFACHWLSMSHAAYNPLIYIWMNGKGQWHSVYATDYRLFSTVVDYANFAQKL